MARITIAFAALLAILGIVFFALTHAPTSLIPLYFAVVLGVLGALANTDDARRRMLFMHIAVTVGLVGLIMPLVRATKPFLHMLQGAPVVRPLAVDEQMLMALVCLIFTALCVRSFIAARRARI